MGVGDGFGADVININGNEEDTDACSSAPQADSSSAEIKNKIM